MSAHFGSKDGGPRAASPGHRTVLIVEDNEDNRLIYSTILEHFGYRVLHAATGSEGVEQARALKPDLILMDVELPELDGWTATRMLKADADTRAIPVIALTAHALVADRQKAVEVGCDAYLAKPVAPQIVADEVRRFIGP